MRPRPPATRDADPYDTLGLTPLAGMDEIKQAYFAQVREHPPERDPVAFKKIRAAYEQLNTPEKKKETDMLRVDKWPESLPPPDVALSTTVSAADIIQAARAVSDLSRTDWREECREIKL